MGEKIIRFFQNCSISIETYLIFVIQFLIEIKKITNHSYLVAIKTKSTMGCGFGRLCG